MKKGIRIWLTAVVILSLITAVSASSTPFEDVPEDAWYAESVSYVYSRGLMQGMTETLFEPETLMSRAMVVTVLYRMDGAPAVSAEHPFTDVPDGSWYTDAVIWAYNNGIVQGVSDDLFDPESDVLREQLVTFAHRYVEYLIGSTGWAEELSGYEDADQISDYAVDAFAWAVENGIIRGTSPVELTPAGVASRAQCAAILERIDRYLYGEEGREPIYPLEPSLGDLFSAEDWKLRLVNRDHPLEDDLELELTTVYNGYRVDSRCYPDLRDMLDDCQAAGLEPLICSAYRTMADQEWLYERKVQQYMDRGYSRERAEEIAATIVAIPGTSEHQVGLAVDIVDECYQWLDEEQENTPAQKWLMKHCWEYGFILRYPSDKSDITGIIYEPWHYRYVGREAAMEIYERDICLEEFLELLEEP